MEASTAARQSRSASDRERTPSPGDTRDAAAGEALLIAFEDARCIAAGPLHDVVHTVWALAQQRPQARIQVFDQASSALLEIETRATADQAVERLRAAMRPHGAAGVPQADVAPANPGPGRPRLGVVAREVTLLPRHWQWLASQPGGASVALRKLVEQAKRQSEPQDRMRQAQEASYRFMSAMAGDLAGFEEASRALFAADGPRFAEWVAAWPTDIRAHLLQLTGPVFHAAQGPEVPHA